MIDYNARLSAAILGVGVALVQIQPAQALTKVEVSKVAQSVTVMIQNAQNSADAGSGIIIKREGETYTVLTAYHVVENSPNYKVMTPDKKINPTVQGSIQRFPGVDLALMQFKSAGAYEVAKIGDSTQSPSGSASFVAGFPATNEIRTESEYYFTSGEIAANGSRPNKDGYALAYSNPTLRGMSGGPVLNEQGELIGIHGRAEKAEQLQNSQLSNTTYVLKTEFNYAIPINTFLTLAPQVNSSLAFRAPSPSVSSAPKADDFFLQAQEKYKRGDYKGAITDLDEAIRLAPKLAMAYHNRGVIRKNLGYDRNDLGDFKSAIADFDQAISLDPKYASNYNNRGFVLIRLGDNQEAIADFEQAIRLNPKYASAYFGRGVVRSKLGDKQGAITDYSQAISLDPKYATAYINRGYIRNDLGDKKGALADFDQAISLNPKYASAHVNRGRVRYDLGDKQGAIADLDQAILLEPKFAVAYNNRAFIRKLLGNKQGALADIDQAINLNPKYADAYYVRGRIRYDLGDKQMAIADLQKAAVLYKSQGDEKSYQDVLEDLKQINGLYSNPSSFMRDVSLESH
jgi:tetratricopeptide (TPR) repeat protein